MGKIEIIGKYNLYNNNWFFGNNNFNEISLAIANYEPIKNNDSEKYNYIIYCYGSRVENHSKNAYNIKEKQAHVDNILNYFKTKNHNIIVKFIMLDKDAPLKEDGIVLANYINSLCNNGNCNSVNLLGYSKSGVMFFEMIKHIKIKNFSKINLYNIATPYLGTKMASPKIIYADVKTFVDNHISNKQLADKIYNHLIKFYESISSNSHMDYDIALEDGVPKDKLDKYDDTLIKGLLLQDNINAIKSLNRLENFTTGIDNTTLRRALMTANFNGIGMCLIDDMLMGKDSDGFVHTKSEEVISNYLDVSSQHIKGAHHDLMSDNLYYSGILYNLSDNLSEDREKSLTKKRIIL